MRMEWFIPKKRLKWPRHHEDAIYIVEVSKVRIDLQHPVRLDENHGRDVELGDATGIEGLNLHPGDDIV
jgi:hypothetical protein